MPLDRAIERIGLQRTSVASTSKAQYSLKPKYDAGYVKFPSPNDHKLPQIQRAELKKEKLLRNHTRIEALGWQPSELSSLAKKGLPDFGGMREVRTKASMDHTGYSKGQSSGFNGRQLKFLFKKKFEALLQRNQYISPSPEQEHEFSSINYDTDLLDVRKEWREAFSIARGQIFEEMIKNEMTIEDNLLDNSSGKIMLFREASTKINEVSDDSLSSTVTDMFKQYPNQEVIAYISIINKNHDSYNTCLDVHEKLSSPSEQKLQESHYPQKLQEFRNFLVYREEALKPQLLFLRINSEAQFLEDDLKERLSQPTLEYIKTLETELLRLQREEQAELRRYQSYYMMLGAPEIRSIVKKLSNTSKIDYIMLMPSNKNNEKSEAKSLNMDASSNVIEDYQRKGSYIVRLAFKRLGNDNLGQAHTDQITRQQQSFKQNFLQVLAEQDSPPHLLEKYASAFSSINSNARVFDLPTEWQKPFLIARGQAYESIRKAGTILSNNPYSTLLPKNEDLMLYIGTSDRENKQISKHHLPSALATFFKQRPHEKVIISTTTDEHEPDTRFTCKVICEDQSLQVKPELSKDLYCQKLEEWIELRNRQDKQEIKMLRGQIECNKKQFSLVLAELQKEIKSEKQFMAFQQYLDELKDFLIYERDKRIDKQKIEAAHKKHELSQAQKISDAYDMIFGTPKAWSIIKNLPRDYTIDSITLEPLAADIRIPPSGAWLAGNDYKISFCITHVGSGGERK